MQETPAPKPVGTILIVSGLGLILAIIILTMIHLITVITTVVAQVDHPGTHAIQIQDAGHYAFAIPEPGEASSGFNLVLSDEPTDPSGLSISRAEGDPLQPTEFGTTLAVDGERFRILGSMKFEPGSHELMVNGPSEAFPVTIRRAGRDIGRSALIYAAIGAQVPVCMLIAGGIIAGRNANRRAQAERQRLDSLLDGNTPEH